MTARGLERIAALLLVGAALGCGDSGSEPRADRMRSESEAPPARGEREFAAFSQRDLVIGTLNEPIHPPLVVGSRPSGRTIVSEDPTIVAVDEEGRIFARREGSTLLRAFGADSRLRVDVIVARSLRIEPATVRLRAGESAMVRVVSETGAAISTQAVQWWTSDPSVARAAGGVVRGGETRGTATIEARFGGIAARARVEVAGPPPVEFVIRPERARVHVGEVLPLEARTPSGPVDVEWTTRDARIVRHLQGSVVWAVAPGRTEVCARRGMDSMCTTMEVLP